ncbi:HIT family protein [Actinoplanes sp. OR16]|uniref:HIT family protein n=1 Tax=Actinoplanes sp. OR16 TaxID=946334 RepID=UPI000FD9DBD2|nr:HIT family protein [Actinoplanes sp. OR16]
MADCVFCGIVAGSVPAFLVASSPAGVAFLDIRPVFKGHVLIVPRPHIVQLIDLPAADLSGYFRFVQLIAAAVPAALGSQGTFVAENNIVSQSVPHLHTHVVPRTKGDGLRGFFWPRHKYASDEEALDHASRIGDEYRSLALPEG